MKKYNDDTFSLNCHTDGFGDYNFPVLNYLSNRVDPQFETDFNEY